MTSRGPNRNIEAIREMIDHRLKSISASATVALPPDSHLDEDTISAFVEGRMSAVESKPVLSHLTACTVCRRASAQLVRLENQIDPEPERAPDQPGRLQAFLANLQTLAPPNEDVVFAYQNPQDDEEPADTSAKPDGKSSQDKS